MEATRAAAAWTPPPASKVSAESVTRGKRSASSYAAYSSDDHAAFASQLDQVPVYFLQVSNAQISRTSPSGVSNFPVFELSTHC